MRAVAQAWLEISAFKFGNDFRCFFRNIDRVVQKLSHRFLACEKPDSFAKHGSKFETSFNSPFIREQCHCTRPIQNWPEGIRFGDEAFFVLSAGEIKRVTAIVNLIVSRAIHQFASLDCAHDAKSVESRAGFFWCFFS